MASNRRPVNIYTALTSFDEEKERERQLELEYEDFMERHAGEDPYYYKEPYATWLRN